DVVLTGEGAVDRTSLEGKTLAGILRRARRFDKPVLVLTGKWGPGSAQVRRRIQGAVLIAPGLSEKESVRQTPTLLPNAAMSLSLNFQLSRHPERSEGPPLSRTQKNIVGK